MGFRQAPGPKLPHGVLVLRVVAALRILLCDAESWTRFRSSFCECRVEVKWSTRNEKARRACRRYGLPTLCAIMCNDRHRLRTALEPGYPCFAGVHNQNLRWSPPSLACKIRLTAHVAPLECSAHKPRRFLSLPAERASFEHCEPQVNVIAEGNSPNLQLYRLLSRHGRDGTCDGDGQRGRVTPSFCRFKIVTLMLFSME